MYKMVIFVHFRYFFFFCTVYMDFVNLNVCAKLIATVQCALTIV